LAAGEEGICFGPIAFAVAVAVVVAADILPPREWVAAAEEAGAGEETALAIIPCSFVRS